MPQPIAEYRTPTTAVVAPLAAIPVLVDKAIDDEWNPTEVPVLLATRLSYPFLYYFISYYARPPNVVVLAFPTQSSNYLLLSWSSITFPGAVQVMARYGVAIRPMAVKASVHPPFVLFISRFAV